MFRKIAVAAALAAAFAAGGAAARNGEPTPAPSAGRCEFAAYGLSTSRVDALDSVPLYDATMSRAGCRQLPTGLWVRR